MIADLGMAVESKTGDLLDAAQREGYERDGYLVIDDPCPAKLVDEVLADVEPLLADDSDPGPELLKDDVIFYRYPGQEQGPYHWQRVMNAWRSCASVRAMALAPKVLAITEELFGRKVLPFQTLNFPVGTQQPAHQDSVFFHSDPHGYMCGVWVALEDMDMENGPLVYYPGSHKLPYPSWGDVDRETGYEASPSEYGTPREYKQAREKQYRLYCDQVISKHGLQPEYGTIRKGQALLWSPHLMHGGARQVDKRRTRHSQVTHYFFEGCRHYRPTFSYPGHTAWQYPAWIRDPVPYDTTEAIHEAIKGCVPGGSTVAIATDGYEGLLEIEGRTAWHFPQADDGTHLTRFQIGDDPVGRLEQLRERGARYIAFPKLQLPWLENDAPALQQHLEDNHRAVLRDGALCVIFALDRG